MNKKHIVSLVLSTLAASGSAFAGLKQITHPTCEVYLPHIPSHIIEAKIAERLGNASVDYQSEVGHLVKIFEHKLLKQKLLDKGYFPVAKYFDEASWAKGFLHELDHGDLAFSASYEYEKRMNQGLKNAIECTATLALEEALVDEEAEPTRHVKTLYSHKSTKTNYIFMQKVPPCEQAMRSAIKSLPKCVIK